MSIAVSISIAHYCTNSRSSALHSDETMQLQQATKAGNLEVWMTQVISQWVPDCRTHQGKDTISIRVRIRCSAKKLAGCYSIVWQLPLKLTYS